MTERDKKEERMSCFTHKHNHIVEPTGRRKRGKQTQNENKTNINKRSEQRTVKIIKQTNKQTTKKSYFYTRVQNQTQNKNKKERKQLPNVKR